MIGHGVAAQAAAFHAAGVRLTRIAGALGHTVADVCDLVVGFGLQDALRRQPDLELVSVDGVCRMGGCGRPWTVTSSSLRLSAVHQTRFYNGRPLLGGRGPVRPRLRVLTCPVCGATWCPLTRRSNPPTCGSARCRRLHKSSPAVAHRNAIIEDMLRRGLLHRSIADRFGVSVVTVAQIAAAADLQRRPPLDEIQRAARARRAAQRGGGG